MGIFKANHDVYKNRKVIEFWSNLVQNADEACSDTIMFEMQFEFISPSRVIDMLKGAYTVEELKDMDSLRHFRLDSNDVDDVAYSLKTLWNATGKRVKCKSQLVAIANEILSTMPMPGDDDVFGLRLKEFQRALKLSDLELEIATFAFLWSERKIRYIRDVNASDRPMLFAMALNRGYDEITHAISSTGSLRKFNVLDEDCRFNEQDFSAFFNGTENEAVTRCFYRKCDVSDALPWNYHGELAQNDGEVIKLMLTAIRPLAAQGKGRLNILLYGSTGTGKTSFAKTLANELKCSTFEITQGGEKGKKVPASSRLTGINVCNEYESGENSLMIVDEADELLRFNDHAVFGSNRGITEKGVINELLDGMKMPAIWISNSPIQEMDESVRRRFDYSIRYDALNETQRKSVWRNAITKYAMNDLIP